VKFVLGDEADYRWAVDLIRAQELGGGRRSCFRPYMVVWTPKCLWNGCCEIAFRRA
jgi:hypothetical protein